MKISFIPFEKSNYEMLLEPVPAIKQLPEWYKAKRPFVTGDKQKIYPNDTKNVTVKWCNPFGDALGFGYFILLENELQVSKDKDVPKFVWTKGGDNFISEHAKEQIDKEAVPAGFDSQPYKFQNYWGIKTPRGYSVLFTHPLNRPELPFFTLAGVVDTDTYNSPVNFPFFIRDDFEGNISAGTPIAQVIPFKREGWSAKAEKFDQEKVEAIVKNFKRTFSRPYKTLFWQRKHFA